MCSTRTRYRTLKRLRSVRGGTFDKPLIGATRCINSLSTFLLMISQGAMLGRGHASWSASAKWCCATNVTESLQHTLSRRTMAHPRKVSMRSLASSAKDSIMESGLGLATAVSCSCRWTRLAFCTTALRVLACRTAAGRFTPMLQAAEAGRFMPMLRVCAYCLKRLLEPIASLLIDGFASFQFVTFKKRY